MPCLALPCLAQTISVDDMEGLIGRDITVMFLEVDEVRLAANQHPGTQPAHTWDVRDVSATQQP